MQIFSAYFATESKVEYVQKWHILPLTDLAKRLDVQSLHLKKVQKLAYLQCVWCVIGVWGRRSPGRAHSVVRHALEAAMKDTAGTVDFTKD